MKAHTVEWYTPEGTFGVVVLSCLSVLFVYLVSRLVIDEYKQSRSIGKAIGMFFGGSLIAGTLCGLTYLFFWGIPIIILGCILLPLIVVLILCLPYATMVWVCSESVIRDLKKNHPELFDVNGNLKPEYVEELKQDKENKKLKSWQLPPPLPEPVQEPEPIMETRGSFVPTISQVPPPAPPPSIPEQPTVSKSAKKRAAKKASKKEAKEIQEVVNNIDTTVSDLEAEVNECAAKISEECKSNKGSHDENVALIFKMSALREQLNVATKIQDSTYTLRRRNFFMYGSENPTHEQIAEYNRQH
jgi:hypothetical protein